MAHSVKAEDRLLKWEVGIRKLEKGIAHSVKTEDRRKRSEDRKWKKWEIGMRKSEF